MTQNIKFGKLGEHLASHFLTRHGYEIVAGHWQKRVGEIDVIAYDARCEELAFVEVKTRSSTNFGYPEETVNNKKLLKIKKTAQWFLFTYNYPLNQKWRLDVISIIVNQATQQAEITHFKNVNNS